MRLNSFIVIFDTSGSKALLFYLLNVYAKIMIVKNIQNVIIATNNNS